MKSINFEYKSEKYVLEFDRATVKYLEDTGFNIEELTKKPATMIPMLFYASFRKNHSGIKRKTVDEMYDSLKDKSDLLSALVELYSEPLESLLDNEKGNVTWGKNW